MIAALLGEGSSDRVLVPILRWLIGACTPAPFDVAWIDPALLFAADPTVRARVRAALQVQPCDLLFVHRDADRQDPARRRGEIRRAAGAHPHVPVVPVRMTEAWLLLDERALRAAAGRVSGTHPLNLPDPRQVEALPNPKRTLRDALVRAHGARGRRARRFRPDQAQHRLADLVEDWSPLRALPAFRRVEADTRAALDRLGVPIRPRP